MQRSLAHFSLATFLLLLVLCINSCGVVGNRSNSPIRNGSISIGGQPTHSGGRLEGAGSMTTTIDTITTRVLTNMHDYSWNKYAMTQGLVSGGLAINWKMSNPSIINIVTPGADGNPLHNHDPQVELLYLTSLVEYSQQHPGDKTYDRDIARMLPFVHKELQQYNLPKGWLYFDVLKIGLLTQNKLFLQDARTIAQNFYQNWYDPSLGFVYNNQHVPGDYNPNHSLQCGAALIDAGIRWQRPVWQAAGESTINHILSVALDPTYHLFYNNMTVSYNGQDKVQNYQAKPSTQGEAVDALVTAYTLTHKQSYLDVAYQVLASTFNSGLWDQAQQGFFFALDASTGTILSNYKETRSQTLMLVAVHHYNQVKADFLPQEQSLIDVVANHFYESTYGGFFYRTTPDFHVYVSRSSTGPVVEDYFTTEAMGSALDALLQATQQ